MMPQEGDARSQLRRRRSARYDMLPIYMDSAQYPKFAQETFIREKALAEKLGLAKAS